MMRYAHQLAKMLVERTEDYPMTLSLALTEVWRQVNLYGKKRFTKYSIANAYARLVQPKVVNSKNDVHGVPAWIIKKNLSSEQAYAVLNECETMEVKRETEKAQLVEFNTQYGNIEMWTPKSVLVS